MAAQPTTEQRLAPVKYNWEVHTLIPKGQATTACQMNVVAEKVDQVWDFIAADRADQNTEVVALIRRDPVVAVLS